MRWRAVGFIFAALPIAAAAQQVLCTLGSGTAGYKTTSDERPTSDAMELIGKTFEAAKAICGRNCPETVLYRNATAPNVMLMVAGGRGKIVYSPAVFTGIYDKYGDPGVEALLAHELGHELDDVLGAAWIEKSWNAELRADAWAGCILAKAGLNDSAMTTALQSMQEYPSAQHPVWSARLPVIRTGYSHCAIGAH